MLFQAEVQVTKTDNGYVLEWSDERADDYKSVGTYQPRKTRGVEVFTDRKALLARIKELL